MQHLRDKPETLHLNDLSLHGAVIAGETKIGAQRSPRL